MLVSRRHFLGATSGAATLSALATRTPAQEPADPLADPLGVRRDFPAADEYTFLKISIQRGETDEPAGPDAQTRVRVAVSFFNNAADIQRLLGATEKLRVS